MVFQLKDDCGMENIKNREIYLARKALDFLSNSKNLKLLGSPTARRVPIFSFIIEHKQTERFLHHKFTASLLNDLFGLQTRAGCACAGKVIFDFAITVNLLIPNNTLHEQEHMRSNYCLKKCRI